MHPKDLVNFSLASVYVHTCCGGLLQQHQQRLLLLTAMDDRNRWQTLQLFRDVFLTDEQAIEAWYHRKIEMRVLHPRTLRDLNSNGEEI